ncbi:MAG TPA: EamA family transporter [Cyanobacteria bacterium UBA11149]|nr:EamA family transporter [Cyanobacteria bacterium UBA11367]HBE58903.1 EamA family transporter [Cyanobacteria bacterium UBA11366]HBK65411.1 EamA family transporter [Cyanobacteria bacterium UBA11166]HBR73547.1 EamA family transporter [Cyanobacteria bacterium UBA11159]HBS71772.1 EamA family transporter [Cyanobacteria bacterium UBA11153]HBW92223.1 EamA family transporter [Cyanobacteria bacterium UBA11149]HCA93970.1 EamA family transporter [Cyanobacteria bacterium UBA9226]
MIPNKEVGLDNHTKHTSIPAEVIPFVLLIIALFALALTGILVKFSLREMSVNETLFNRSWIAAIVFGLWNGFYQLRIQQSDEQFILKKRNETRDYGLLLGASVAYMVGRLLWTWSLTETSVANANVIGGLSPVFTTLGAWLLFKQIFDRRFLIGLVVAILGAIVLGLDDLIVSKHGLIGDLAALGCAILYAATYLILEYLRSKFSVETVLMWRCSVGTILTLPLVLTSENQLFPSSLSGWLIVFSLAVVCEALGHGLTVYSLKRFSSTFVLMVYLLDPVIAATLAWILFSEQLSLVNWLGFAIIMVGIYLGKTGKGAEKKSNSEQIEPKDVNDMEPSF